MLAYSGVNREHITARPEKKSQASTLSDICISRDQSSRWQKLASVPEEKFEQAIASAKEAYAGNN